MNDHVDISRFIAAKSDQLNADDLMDSPRTITITKVTASPDATEQPVSLHYEGGEGRPFKPCKTVRRILVSVWGKDASKYVGRSMTLYRDGKVQFGGLQVGGIRVSHMSHISEDKTVALLVTKGRKAPFTIKPLLNAPKEPASASDGAAKWASGYVARLDTFADLPTIEAFEAEKAPKLQELASARPDLHQSVTQALATRKAALAPQSDFADDDLAAPQTDAFGLDPVADKPASEEAGERILSDVGSASDDDALTKAMASYATHKAALPDELCVKIEIEADKRRREIEATRETAGAS